MKKNISIFQRLAVFASLLFVVNCGLQVRSNPGSTITIPNPNTAGDLYKISGKATGIKYEPVDVPTNYAAGMPESIRLSINGTEFVVSENGPFSVPGSFKSGDDYVVQIVDNGIEIPHQDGVSPSIYLNCDLTNNIGTIVDADITDVQVDCFLSDSQYKDPE